MAFWEEEIRSLTGKAIHRFGMIEDGDRILVGVSGGKDSLTLLTCSITQETGAGSLRTGAGHVKPRFGSDQERVLAGIFEGAGLILSYRTDEIGRRAIATENRRKPCFLCSWERRKRSFRWPTDSTVTRSPWGHHKDDIIETFLLNILYSAEMSTMLPVNRCSTGKSP